MPSYRAMIGATGLRKAYGGKLVLGGVDLTLAKATTFALLGANGVGKTTAVHIPSTLIGAVGGGAVRAAIGVTGQFSVAGGLLAGEAPQSARPGAARGWDVMVAIKSHVPRAGLVPRPRLLARLAERPVAGEESRCPRG